MKAHTMHYSSNILFITTQQHRYSYRETGLHLIKDAFPEPETIFLESAQTGFTSAYNEAFEKPLHSEATENTLAATQITILHAEPIPAHKKSSLLQELKQTYKQPILSRFNQKA